ncbi:MAG: hypothetical protein AB7T14_05290 [Candidatus Methylacidiphilaceae bacterium]
MRTRVLRGVLLGCLLVGWAVSLAPGKLFGFSQAIGQRLQSSDDPEPGQEPEERPGHQPGTGAEEPGAPKSPSEPPFTPAPYFPEIPQFQPDEPFVP